jgi:16S rRNA processing protein RimM
MVLAMAKPASAKGSASTGTRVCVAAVAAAHGVRGLVRLKPFTEQPEDCLAYGPLSTADGGRVFKLEKLGLHKGQVLVRIEGVNDRTAAEALRGTRLYVERDALPAPEDEDEFYHADLIGLKAVLTDGSELGIVRAVYDFGAGDTLEIKGKGKPVLVPFTLEAVPEVDIAGGKVVIDPPPGLLDGPDSDGPDGDGPDSEEAEASRAGEGEPS